MDYDRSIKWTGAFVGFLTVIVRVIGYPSVGKLVLYDM